MSLFVRLLIYLESVLYLAFFLTPTLFGVRSTFIEILVVCWGVICALSAPAMLNNEKRMQKLFEGRRDIVDIQFFVEAVSLAALFIYEWYFSALCMSLLVMVKFKIFYWRKIKNK